MTGTLLLANALFILACGVIGLRLLLLSRRTHALPEFYLGLGLTCMVAAFAALGASGLGRETAGDVNLALTAVGMALLWLSITSQVAFTWKTFRADSAWAELLVMSIGAVEAVAVGGLLYALGAAERATPSFEAARDWTSILRLPMLLGYAWAGVEAWHQLRRARRRDALGLGDPIVTNRFLLWASMSFCALAGSAVSMGLHLAGKGPLADPLAAGVLALAGAGAGVLLWLAFLPPAWYSRFISQRAARVGASPAGAR